MDLTPEEEAQSQSEGWAVSYGCTHIRHRYGGPFTSWPEMYTFIVKKADEGSELHRKVFFSLPQYDFEIYMKNTFQVIQEKHTAHAVARKLVYGHRKTK